MTSNSFGVVLVLSFFLICNLCFQRVNTDTKSSPSGFAPRMLVFVYCALAFRPDGGPGRHPRQHAARRRPRKDGERLPPGRRCQPPPSPI